MTLAVGTLRADDDNDDKKPDGKGHKSRDTKPAPTDRAGRITPIQYHGGPILTGTVHTYAIYYGNWSGSQIAIINNLLGHIGGSPYFNINTTYYNGQNVHVSNAVTLAGTTTMPTYPLGKSLSDANIQTIVSNAITGGLPSDTNAVYFVITSQDVTATSGFCTQYCGWHDHGTIGGKDIKYAFIGNPARCPNACAAQTSSSPNNDIGVDGAVSIIAHELEEAVTDPDLNAWFDRSGNENADKCAWTFGKTYTAPNGSVANMNIGGMNFLIQQNWVQVPNAGNCSLQYP